MATSLLTSAVVVVVCSLPAARALAATLQVRAGEYAENASETTRNGYSNGGVGVVVAKGGKKITLAGVACYTGTTPPEGLPANDEVTIRAPHQLAISSTGSFSFSGLVTLTPEETQSETPFTTTFTIKGHFQNGKIAAVGTDSSPVCQPGTLTHFKLRL